MPPSSSAGSRDRSAGSRSEDDEARPRPVARAEDADPSKVALHDAGNCKPCLYVNTKAGCKNGPGCLFCHFPHVKKSRPRLCKAKRDQVKRIVGSAVNAETTPEAADALLSLELGQDASRKGTYVKSVIRGATRASQERQAGTSQGRTPSPTGAPLGLVLNRSNLERQQAQSAEQGQRNPQQRFFTKVSL